MVFLGGLVSFTLFAFGFFYITYFVSDDSQDASSAGATPKKITEEVVQKVDQDISDIQKELENDFYKKLRKYTWTPDTKNPGKQNPFVQ